MLFNNYIFIFLFLPMSLLLFFSLAKINKQMALGFLFLASLFFYSWANYRFGILLIFSISINYLISYYMSKSSAQLIRKMLLIFGLLFNLGLLSYFKYSHFFIENMNALFGFKISLFEILLPVGISFFTFTQIAFLVDCYRGIVSCYPFVNYALFVTYFPHLIAGPIIHHQEVMPQFEKNKTFTVNYKKMAIGFTLFAIGLFKKTVLADNLVFLVSPVFDNNANYISTLQAWMGSLAYTLELYFDFSGYSDMAVGLSLLFGVKLPINFYSPYKAVNIIEFWRRWNITLSRFLRDYLYIPLGGNRNGKFRRYVNLILTMVLGGFWHGASWTFIFWGFLHGVYLCINHSWLALQSRLSIPKSGSLFKLVSQGITFLCVMVAWIFFRSPSFDKALQILHSMFSQPVSLTSLLEYNYHSSYGLFIVVTSLAIVWLLPNSYQILRKYKPGLFTYHYNEILNRFYLFSWQPTLVWNYAIAFLFVIGILHIQTSSVFLYFRF